MISDRPLVFHWRQPDSDKARRAGPAALGMMLVAIAIVFWFSFPAGILTKIDWVKVWVEAWEKLRIKPSTLVEFTLYLVAITVFMFGHVLHKRRARLTLGTNTLGYSSGLPFIGRWLDWTLDIEAVRRNALPMQVIGVAIGPQPTNNYRLSWGKGQFERIRPAAWHLPGSVPQASVASVKPASWFGLVRWQAPENQALLQQQLNQLPLITALRQRGVMLPPLNAKRQSSGLDLMARPRMKVAVITFFVGVLAAFVLFHLMRHHHYFTPPPQWVWICVGLAAGLCMLAWLWPEHLGESDTANALVAIEYRSTQVLLAALIAVVAGLSAPSMPLLFSSLTQASRYIAFELTTEPLRLRAMAAREVPDIHPDQAMDFWLNQSEGTAFSLPVRQGLAGMWWQFDSRVLQARLDAFYGSKPLH